MHKMSPSVPENGSQIKFKYLLMLKKHRIFSLILVSGSFTVFPLLIFPNNKNKNFPICHIQCPVWRYLVFLWVNRKNLTIKSLYCPCFRQLGPRSPKSARNSVH